MMTAFELAGKLKLDSSEFTSSLNQQESAFKSFGEKIGKTASAITKVMGASVAAGAVMFTKKSISEGMEFDTAMSQVAATLGKTKEEIGELSAFAREMGSKTAFSATQAAEALNYMALAGYDSEKSMKMLPAVLDLAAAGSIDLARASQIVTNSANALGLSTEETTKLIDQMAKTSTKTGTTVEQLGEAILTIGGTAKNLRGGTKELNALLGVLADNGLQGAEGGTALRNVLLSLSAPTDKASKTLKKLGVEVYDANGKMKSMPTILQNINKATEKMTAKERTEAFNSIFNKRDLKAVEALLGTNMERWQELYKEIENAGGAASQMARTQLDNLKGDITLLKSAMSEMMISISGKITPALRKFTKLATKSVDNITKAFNEKGLKGALEASFKSFHSFGYLLQNSTNPIISKLGKTMTQFYIDVRRGKREIVDISSGITYFGGIAKREFGKLKDWLSGNKVKLAEWLGVDDSQSATWYDIAAKAYTNLKNNLSFISSSAKTSVAQLLGMTDENGNPIDNGDDVTWTDIAKDALKKLKNKIKNFAADQKVKIADILGLDDDASWGDIASQIYTNIKAKIKEKAEDAKIKVAELLGFEDGENVSWSDIAKKIKENIEAKIDSAKIKVAELLGFEEGENASWSDIAKKIKENIEVKFDSAKITLAKMLGFDDDENISWSDIAKKIKENIEAKLDSAKIKVAELLGFEDGENVKWEDIAKKIGENIRGKIDLAKIKVAELLGFEDAENAKWSDIAENIGRKIKDNIDKAKVKVAELLGFEDAENAKWSDIAANIAKTIKDNIGTAKVKLAELIGFEDGENAKWSDIAAEIGKNIKTKIGTAKIKIAELLGFEDGENVTWGDIAKKIKENIEANFGSVKITIAKMLGFEDSEDVTWSGVAEKVKEKLETAMDGVKVSIAKILGIENATEAEWEEIGRKVVGGLTSYVGNKGNFLKQLILGSDYQEGKSDWADVGTKISGWIKESFGEGGFLSTLLGTAAEQAAALSQLAGNFMTELANWIGNNSEQISGIISSIIDAIALAAPKIVDAISAVLRDPKLWVAIGDLIKSIWQAIFGTPEGNLEENLFGNFSKEDFKQLNEYIKEWNDQRERLKKLDELSNGGKEGTSEFKTLAADAEAANEKIAALVENLKNVNDENGNNLLTNYQTWAYNQGLGENYELPELPVKFAPDDEDVTELMDEGYETTATVDPDDESVTETMDTGYETIATVDPDDEAVTELMDTGYETIATLDPDDEPITTLLEEAGYEATVKLVPDTSSMPKGGVDDVGGVKATFNAKGLWDVPFDDYRAILHRGETVLTASQARRYKEGESGGFDLFNLKEVIMSAVRQGMQGVAVNSYLDGRSITDEVSRILGNSLAARRFA